MKEKLKRIKKIVCDFFVKVKNRIYTLSVDTVARFFITTATLVVMFIFGLVLNSHNAKIGFLKNDLGLLDESNEKTEKELDQVKKDIDKKLEAIQKDFLNVSNKVNTTTWKVDDIYKNKDMVYICLDNDGNYLLVLNKEKLEEKSNAKIINYCVEKK